MVPVAAESIYIWFSVMDKAVCFEVNYVDIVNIFCIKLFLMDKV